jgi:hypothetical protein
VNSLVDITDEQIHFRRAIAFTFADTISVTYERFTGYIITCLSKCLFPFSLTSLIFHLYMVKFSTVSSFPSEIRLIVAGTVHYRYSHK